MAVPICSQIPSSTTPRPATSANLSWEQTNDNGLWYWDLNFNLSSAPASGNYWLTIAYSGSGWGGGAQSGYQQISVNGHAVLLRYHWLQSMDWPRRTMAEKLTRHTTLPHGAYSFIHVPIASSMLHSGSNTITLTANGVILYDHINMETPTLSGQWRLHLVDREHRDECLHASVSVQQRRYQHTTFTLIPGSGASLNQWQVVNLGASRNYCEFINVASGLALTGSAGGVTQAPLVGSSNQIWQVRRVPRGGYLVRCSGQVSTLLTAVPSRSLIRPAAIRSCLSGANGGAAGQNWVFTMVPPTVNCPSAIATNINTPCPFGSRQASMVRTSPLPRIIAASGFNWSPSGSNLVATIQRNQSAPGVTIDSVTGLISGYASATGTYSATIMATNSGGTGSQPVTFTVGVPLSGLSVPVRRHLTWGVPYSAQVTGISGDVTGFSATGLPPGITIDAYDGTYFRHAHRLRLQ